MIKSNIYLETKNSTTRTTFEDIISLVSVQVV